MTSPINPSEPHNIFLKKKTFSFHSKQVRCFQVPWIDFSKEWSHAAGGKCWWVRGWPWRCQCWGARRFVWCAKAHPRGPVAETSYHVGVPFSRVEASATNVFARSQQAKSKPFSSFLGIDPDNLQVPYTMRQALSSRSDVQTSLKANHWRFPATSYVDVLRWLELGGWNDRKRRRMWNDFGIGNMKNTDEYSWIFTVIMQSCYLFFGISHNLRVSLFFLVMVECHSFAAWFTFANRQEWNPKFRCRVNSVPTWVLKLDLKRWSKEKFKQMEFVMKKPQVPWDLLDTGQKYVFEDIFWYIMYIYIYIEIHDFLNLLMHHFDIHLEFLPGPEVSRTLCCIIFLRWFPFECHVFLKDFMQKKSCKLQVSTWIPASK